MELQTKPSPMGRRVVPRVDSALRNKAQAAAAKKLKKVSAKFWQGKKVLSSLLLLHFTKYP